MIEILYCNQNSIIERLAESLVIGGLPMETKKITARGLKEEIDNLCEILDIVWDYKVYFDFDKKKKIIRVKKDINNNALYELILEFIMYDEIDIDNPNSESINNVLEKYLDKYTKRGRTLGHVKTGSGHNSLYKGVSFNMVIKFPLYWLKQYQRYNFTDVISSQSTMHKILEFDLSEMFSDKVDKRCIAVIEELRDKYNNETDKDKKKDIWETIINSCPDGLHMCMGITMNYLQASSIINQRKNHKLSEWSKDFVPYLQSLPYYDFFMGE